MTKPNIPSNMIMLKFPNISEICATWTIQKTGKWLEKWLRVSANLSLDARTTKILISHNFSLLIKTMHISHNLATKNNNQ